MVVNVAVVAVEVAIIAPAPLEHPPGEENVKVPPFGAIITRMTTIAVVVAVAAGGEIEDDHVAILTPMAIAIVEVIEDAAVAPTTMGGDIAVVAMAATMTVGRITMVAVTVDIAVAMAAIAADPRMDEDHRHPDRGKHMPRSGIPNSQCCVSSCGRRSWRRSGPRR